MENSTFAVIHESTYESIVLFKGTKSACKQFMQENPEMCSTYTVLVEMEYA